jgi:hypothetical protein
MLLTARLNIIRINTLITLASGKVINPGKSALKNAFAARERFRQAERRPSLSADCQWRDEFSSGEHRLELRDGVLPWGPWPVTPAGGSNGVSKNPLDFRETGASKINEFSACSRVLKRLEIWHDKDDLPREAQGDADETRGTLSPGIHR